MAVVRGIKRFFVFGFLFSILHWEAATNSFVVPRSRASGRVLILNYLQKGCRIWRFGCGDEKGWWGKVLVLMCVECVGRLSSSNNSHSIYLPAPHIFQRAQLSKVLIKIPTEG